MMSDEKKILNTDVLPKYNCSNCAHFKHGKGKKIFGFGADNPYAYECMNLVHPLLDCVLRGFEGHSEQPGFSQTLNKKNETNKTTDSCTFNDVYRCIRCGISGEDYEIIGCGEE